MLDRLQHLLRQGILQLVEYLHQHSLVTLGYEAFLGRLIPRFDWLCGRQMGFSGDVDLWELEGDLVLRPFIYVLSGVMMRTFPYALDLPCIERHEVPSILALVYVHDLLSLSDYFRFIPIVLLLSLRLGLSGQLYLFDSREGVFVEASVLCEDLLRVFVFCLVHQAPVFQVVRGLREHSLGLISREVSNAQLRISLAIE